MKPPKRRFVPHPTEKPGNVALAARGVSVESKRESAVRGVITAHLDGTMMTAGQRDLVVRVMSYLSVVGGK